MKKMFLMLSFVIGISVVAQAQFMKKSPEQRASHITRVLKNKLKLTDEQSVKIKSAFLAQATRMDSLRTNRAANKRVNRINAKLILLNTQKNVMAVLNDDQQKQFIKWEKMRRRRFMLRHAQNMDLKG